MRVSLAALLLVLGFGCRQNPTVVVPPSFERPGAVAFFCVDVGSSSIVPLAECQGLDGVSTEDHALTALVAQTASGEVASVDLRLDRIIDADLRVPGFTFKRVGEVPTAIVVDPNRPAVTYVASFGSRRVEYYDTADFREDVARGAGLPETAHPWVQLPDGPTDLVLSPDGDALYAALPNLGAVAIIPINPDGSLGTLDAPEDPSAYTLVPVVAPDPMPLASAARRSPFDARPVACEGGAEPRFLGALWTGQTCVALEGCGCEGADCEALFQDAGGQAAIDRCLEAFPTYERVCPTDIELRRPTLETPKQVLPAPGTAAAPVGLHVDGDTLLVLDEALPLIHRFTALPSGLTPLEPLAPGVPVREVALTPEVPRTVGGAATDVERFLYAIDATDGSVLVLDILDGSPTFGAVVPVHVGAGPSDRIRLLGQARTLEVVTPGFPGATCDLGAAEAVAAPDRLRGVFVAVGLGNGLVEFVDVYDLDATCRGGDASCQGPLVATDVRVFIRRHASRIGDYVTTASATIGTPTFSLEGNTGRLTSTGASESGGPGLSPGACPPFFSEVFPNAAGADPLICTVSEPWAARQERWQATWEGAIPGARSGFAHFGTDATTIELGNVRFCDRGVLGSDDVAAAGLEAFEPELGYEGDQLLIVSDPPESKRADPLCEPLFLDETGTRDEIAMRVVQAFQDRVVVDAVPEALRRCYTGTDGASVLFEVEARVRRAFAVTGTRSGFVHRVEADGAGRCFLDRASQPVIEGQPQSYRNARAFSDRTYINPWVSFTITNAGSLVSGDRSVLSFNIGNVPPVLAADVGDRGSSGRASTIVRGLHYSSTDERLYVVDSNADALVQYTLAPLSRDGIFE